jgi:hypothetical protein
MRSRRPIGSIGRRFLPMSGSRWWRSFDGTGRSSVDNQKSDFEELFECLTARDVRCVAVGRLQDLADIEALESDEPV